MNAGQKYLGYLDFEIVVESGGVYGKNMEDCVESLLDFCDIGRNGENVFINLRGPSFEILTY